MHNYIKFKNLQYMDLSALLTIEQEQVFPWTQTKFEDCLRAGYHTIGLEKYGEIIGYGIFSIAADEAEILNIAISLAHRRQGLGKLLLEYFMDIAKQRDVNKIFLEVRVSNYAAIKLYESIGFKQIGVRANYYPSLSGREDALVLSIALT